MSVSQKNNSFVFVFILLAACICVLFWYIQRPRTVSPEKTLPATEAEIIETPEDILLELKASIGDVTIPAFHESF